MGAQRPVSVTLVVCKVAVRDGHLIKNFSKTTLQKQLPTLKKSQPKTLIITTQQNLKDIKEIANGYQIIKEKNNQPLSNSGKKAAVAFIPALESAVEIL